MKLLKTVIAGLSLILLPGLALAQATPQTNAKELNPWIDCGIGAMIFDETTWAAVTSNIIWDLGTTAVISNASSQNTCNSKKAKTALYIGTVYANLTEDIVKGQGSHLRALFDVRGCSTASQQALAQSLRSGLAASLSDSTYAARSSSAKAEELYNLLEASIAGSHAGQCSA